MAVQRCAHIVSGVVANIILADPAVFSYGDGSLVVANSANNIGDTYAGGVFTVVVQPVVPQTQNLTYELLTQLFTAAELTATLTVAASKPAIITWFLKMAANSGNINLTDPAVTTALNYLVAQGLITSARETAILAGTIMNPNA
jgi:16S rRNA G1207 methylase RsmC